MSDSFTCPECHQSWPYFDVRKKRDPRLTSFRTICEGCCERIKSDASPKTRDFHVERNHKTGGTSAQAAHAAAEGARLGDLHRRIWKALAEKPMTADEVARKLGIVLNTSRARLSDLKSAGFVEPTGEHRETEAGRMADVLRAVTKAEQGRDDLQAVGVKWDTTCFWIKPDSSPRFNGQGPARGAECFVTCWAGTGYRSWNAGGKRGVYTHCVNGPNRHGAHPTEKPVSLMREILGDFTNVGQTILDPFMGSGTTGVAAVELGRKFIGIEKDPEHFEVACQRVAKAWEQPRLFTEPAGPKLKTGNLFDEVSA